jgi:hypothetical protein
MSKPKKIEMLKVEDLIPYINNARTHSEEQVLQIASSIKEFGFNAPVLIDGEQGIIAGHGRVQAARKLGLTEVPCVRLDHLSDVQRKAYILADNKIALNASWDFQLLNVEIETLKSSEFDLLLTGFSMEDLQKLSDDMDEQRLNDLSSGSSNNDEPSTDAIDGETAALSFPVDHDQKITIFEAIRIAKAKHSLDTSGDALWSICKEWMENE